MADYLKLFNKYWISEDHWGKSSFQDPEVIVDQLLYTCGGGKLLDVGCGMGSLVRALLKRGIEAYGIDIASSPIAESNRLALGHYRNGSILDIPYDDESFDTVCSTDCLEYLEKGDISKALAELYRVTKRYLFVRLYTSTDRDKKWHLTVEGRLWWENNFFEAGFRKHPLFLDIVSYEGLENEQGAITLLFEKIPHQLTDKYSLALLLNERELHMDMLRESGRRSEARCIRYSQLKWYVRHGDTVLDAACGMGYGSAIIWDSTLAVKVIGLDNSDSAIEYARNMYSHDRPGLEFNKQDVTDLSNFDDNSIDTVFSFETVEHLLEPGKFLDEVYRVLIPGGRFVCSVPNMWVDESGNDPNPYHHHVFDYVRLKSLCEKYFIIEEAFSQVAGGGMILTDSKRSITKVDVSSDNSFAEAEWWLLVGMKDPLVGQKKDYRETFYPPTSDKIQNLVSWGRDYDNPWIFRSIVHPGWRIKSQDELIKLAKRVLEYSNIDSPDKGAALCVLAYRFLEEPVKNCEQAEWLLEEVRKYVNRAEETANPNPHVVRWKISNQYIVAKLLHSSGNLLAAAEDFWRCAQMDFSLFSPLIATKIVDASFQAGWLYLNRNNDYEMAKKAWKHGIRIAYKAVKGSWGEIIGNYEKPFDFGLYEASLIMDFADKCAKGLQYLQQLSLHPGKATNLLFYSPIGNLNNELKECSRQLTEYCRILVEQDKRLSEYDCQLTDRNKQLAESNQKLAEREQLLAELNLQIAESNKLLADSNKLLAECNKMLAERAQQLTERGEQLAERGQQLAERDQQLAESYNMLAEREQLIAESERLYMEGCRHLAERDQQLAEKDQQLAEKERQLAERNQQLANRDSKIQEFKNSYSWRITSPVRYLADKVLPLASKVNDVVKPKPEIQAGVPCFKPHQVKLLHPVQQNRPRIVHALGNFMTGGSSQLVVDLIEHLGHIYEQEIIISYKHQNDSYTGIPIHAYTDLHSPDKVIKILVEFRPSLMHIHYWGDSDKPWYEQIFSAAESYGCKIIENVNTPVEPFLSKAVDHYVYVSNYVYDTFGQRNEKSSVIYPGSNFDIFTRKKRELPDNCIGMVYRLEKDKLNEQSIDVFIKVAQRRPETKVLIVGGGSFLEPYKNAVNLAGVTESFVFTDYVSYQSLPSLYEQMSIFVAPVWQESFGQVSPFAMNMGIVVVGYNIGALSEIIGTTELLAQPGDSDKLADIIIELLNNRKKRISIGEYNRERARKLYSVEVMVERYKKIYQSLLENSN